jgi:5-methylthioribose kinase
MNPPPVGYERLDDAGLRAWLSARPELCSRLGGSPREWRVQEVGDGNLNLVFAITGVSGGVCVKQSLPYVRAVGESWPMPLDRTYFEQLYVQLSQPHVARLAPEFLHFDPQRFALAMELLTGYDTLRQGLLSGQRYPTAARHVAEYVARRAFATSVMGRPFEQVNNYLATFSRNQALTRVTVDLIFTHPYVDNKRNRWTSPQLDELVGKLRSDSQLKTAVARLGHRFLTSHEALLHGDLHTGSVMVTTTDTRIIDAEFATYGPIAFDLGLFVGNLLMAYLCQRGYETRSGERADHATWIAAQVAEFWHEFVRQFAALWCEPRPGDGYPNTFFAASSDERAFALERQRWFADLLVDMLGFAGVEIVRRIIGFAHNADLESIADHDLRAELERNALLLARQLITAPQTCALYDQLLSRSSPQNFRVPPS